MARIRMGTQRGRLEVPELPVDQNKTKVQFMIGLMMMSVRMALTKKDWGKAEQVGLEALDLKWSLDPRFGMSRITDLKIKFEGVEALLQLILKAAKEQDIKLSEVFIPKLRKMYGDLRYALEIEFGIKHAEQEVAPSSDEAVSIRIKSLNTAIEHDKRRLANADAGAQMPKTRARLARAEAELQTLNQTKETGTTMPKDVAAAVVVQNVEVVRHGDKLLIPQNLEIQDAIKLLQDRARYEEEIATIIETYDVFPWDGAIALGLVLKERFGWIPQDGASVMVDSGINSRVSVPWGTFLVPGIDGKMICDVTRKEGRVIFQVQAYVKHKHEHVVKGLLADVKEKLKTSSIYRGQAIKMRFLDEQGRILPIPEPKFIDVLSIDENAVAYAKPVADAIETNLFTPIRRIKELEANGLKLQRSVMLGGVFGTGKTLAAAVAAKLAVQQGMTYIYCTRADELTHALAFGRQYQEPACMIFCEDIDRQMGEERTVQIDDILNIIDGVDTKNDKRMLVFTTNDLDAIQPAMLRPGRLDAVIEVTPPDAEAAFRLVQIYGKKTLSDNLDAERIGEKLNGQIPAVIAEVVKRAKLSQLKFTPVGQLVRDIGTDALLDAADTMVRQLELLNRGEDEYMPLEQALHIVGEHLGTANAQDMQEPMPADMKKLLGVKKAA